MKKVLIVIGVLILALIITFTFFEAMSWYHFGDIPTPVVLWRLIIFFAILTVVLFGILILIKKNK